MFAKSQGHGLTQKVYVLREWAKIRDRLQARSVVGPAGPSVHPTGPPRSRHLRIQPQPLVMRIPQLTLDSQSVLKEKTRAFPPGVEMRLGSLTSSSRTSLFFLHGDRDLRCQVVEAWMGCWVAPLPQAVVCGCSSATGCVWCVTASLHTCWSSFSSRAQPTYHLWQLQSHLPGDHLSVPTLCTSLHGHSERRQGKKGGVGCLGCEENGDLDPGCWERGLYETPLFPLLPGVTRG